MPTDSDPVEGGRDRRGRESRSDGEAERRLVDAVRRDLTEAFPLLSAHQVSTVVERVWLEFQGARVRDYVPVLVRKRARAELRDQVGVDPAARLARTTGAAELTVASEPDGALLSARAVHLHIEHAGP